MSGIIWSIALRISLNASWKIELVELMEYKVRALCTLEESQPGRATPTQENDEARHFGKPATVTTDPERYSSCLAPSTSL